MTPTTRTGAINVHDPRAEDISHSFGYGLQNTQGHLDIGTVSVIVGGGFATPAQMRAEVVALRAIAAHAEALADRLAVCEAETTSTAAHLGEHEPVAS